MPVGGTSGLCGLGKQVLSVSLGDNYSSTCFIRRHHLGGVIHWEQSKSRTEQFAGTLGWH